MNTLFQDIRYGSRMLLKNPGFTLVAVIALALGIGANTAIFSVVNTVLLRPLPYEDPDRLMTLREFHVPKHPDFLVSPGNFTEWEKQNTVFEKIAAYRTSSYILTGLGEPSRIRVALVTAGTMTMLGVNPIQGRDFMAEEDQPGKDSVAIISHGFWQRVFGGDPNIIGQPLTLNSNSYTVVGIMPPTFKFPDATMEVWLPIAFDEQNRQARGQHYLSVIGRLKPGVSREQAQAEMSAIAGRLQEQYPDSNSGWGVNVVPTLEYAVGDIRPALWVLLGAVAFVLLIACANVANLLLARAATRQKEIAIRTALGAGRWQIIRQLLTESVLLAIIGGGAGLLLAAWGIDALLALAPKDLPRINDVTIDGYTLGFTFALVVLTGISFGLAPALQASKPDLNEMLKDAGRGSSGGRHRARVRNTLVVAEVALALVLLVGGGLLIRSFIRLQQVNPGFNTQNALVVNIGLPSKKYSEDRQVVTYFNQLLSNLSTLPGVQSVGGTNVPWLGDFNLGFYIQGQPRVSDADLPSTNYFAVSPDYFKAMGIPLLKGRVFTEHDRADTTRVIVINETMANRYFPGEDPIGKKINITMGPEIFREVVGIVSDVKQDGLAQKTDPQVYEPFQQEPGHYFHVVLRAEGDPTALSGAIRSKALELDKDQPVSSIRTLDEIMHASVAQERFSMVLLGIFAALALVLAAVGLYGVMSYSVTQRTHEIGIRMALGASRRDVLKMVVGQGLLLALVGVGIGLAGAFGLTRLMESLLFGVSATDPITFAAISTLLTGVALAASYVPARRALKVDPMVALRYE